MLSFRKYIGIEELVVYEDNFENFQKLLIEFDNKSKKN